MSTTETTRPDALGCGKCQNGRRTFDIRDAISVASTAELCECRKDLPRRHGIAAWWTTEQVGGDHYEDSMLLEVTASISRELPVSADNYPLHRTTDNCYYPAMVALEFHNSVMLHDTMLRDLAAWLGKLADKLEAMDEPVAESEEAK